MNVSRKFPQSRLRRTRFTSSTRSLVAENSLSVDDLIQPIFVKEDLDGVENIDSLPGISRYGLNALDEEIEKMRKDAEVHAEEDKKKKEGVETRNTADTLIFSTEKAIKDLGEKCPEEEKKAVFENTKHYQDNWKKYSKSIF